MDPSFQEKLAKDLEEREKNKDAPKFGSEICGPKIFSGSGWLPCGYLHMEGFPSHWNSFFQQEEEKKAQLLKQKQAAKVSSWS